MPIIASQTGSLSFPINIQSTMSFGTSGSNIPNYNSVFTNVANQTISPNSGIPIIVLSNDIVLSPNITRSGDELTVVLGSNLTKIALQLSINIQTNAINATDIISVFEFQENDTITGWKTIYLTSFTINNTLSAQTIISQPITPIATYRYRAITYSHNAYTITLSNLQLAVTQFPQTSIREIYSSSGGGFFTSSLQSANVLTGSYSMSLMYNPSNPLTQQNNTPQFLSSGYFPFLPFDIQPGDQIRFEGDETQVYGIISATPQIGFASMSILLDGNVAADTNLNSFLIRRFNPNPSFITIDSDLSTYQGGGGFILPKFITNEMQESFDKNVVSLKERGLIT